MARRATKLLVAVCLIELLIGGTRFRLQTTTGAIVEGTGYPIRLPIDGPPTRITKASQWGGFTWLAQTDGSWSSHELYIPGWLLAATAFAGSLPWLAGTRNRRKSRQWAAAGLCGGCGYDLRATLGQCPECGRTHVLPLRRQPDEESTG